MLFALCVAFASAAASNLLTNPSFEEALAHWKSGEAAVTMEAIRLEEGGAARIAVPDGTPTGWPTLGQRVPVAPFDLLMGEVKVLARDVRGGYGAYSAIEFHDAKGERLSFGQSAGLVSEGDWRTLTVRAVAPENAVSARFCLIVNGHGEALFREARLTLSDNLRPAPIEDEVRITVTSNVACDNLIGMGVEDDGWFYNPENLGHGIDEEDIALREKRIRWLNPSWVRMFFWYKDWNPSGDWSTFTFDSPNMESHYRTLALYQELGAVINVTGVEWGMDDPFGQPAVMAQAIGALFEHLIRDKGFTCVRQWTLTNEPNLHFLQLGYTFERYVELHQLVKQEFTRRGLEIEIIGSDDTAGFEWFEMCVFNETYYAVSDVFASHRYFPYADRVLARYFFEDRLALLRDKPDPKPFVVAEFGFHDTRSGTFANPIMEDYPYALWTFDFIVDGLNRGVAGFTIWCLHEVYYPGGNLMNYGLWNFKDRDWAIRPVYHAIGCFTRMSKRGAVVRVCESTHPYQVRAVVVDRVAFWLNQSNADVPIRFSQALATPATAYTRDTVLRDDSLGIALSVDGNRFTAPPESFGYVVLED